MAGKSKWTTRRKERQASNWVKARERDKLVAKRVEQHVVLLDECGQTPWQRAKARRRFNRLASGKTRVKLNTPDAA